MGAGRGFICVHLPLGINVFPIHRYPKVNQEKKLKNLDTKESYTLF